MLTIKAKIIIASTLVFGLLLGSFAYLIYESSERTELSKLDVRLESQSEKLQIEIEEQLKEQHFPDLDDLSEIRTEGLPNVLTQLYDSTGKVIIADSILSGASADLRRKGHHAHSAERTIRIRGQAYRCLWSPVEIDEQFPFVLQIAAPMTGVQASLRHLQVLFLISIPAALLITAMAAFFITKTAFRPLTAMAETAGRISASSLDQRLHIPSARDEVQSLALTLNGMMERIDTGFRSQRQFVADASHEIRTPLTIINSELEFASKTSDENALRESLLTSLSELDRLGRMVDNLVLLARLDASKVLIDRQATRLDEIVTESVQLMNRLATKKNITINLYIDEAVELSADGEGLKRAILNVLDNAVKYSLAAGEVSVSLRTRGPLPGAAYVIVEDHGPGISESELPLIFRRFFRGENARAESDGSGLGLAIAQGLVELHGGKIDLHSRLGHGTTVTIELPIKGPQRPL